jgi:hypothetical protein
VFGQQPIESITTEEIEAWRRSLTGLSNRSKNKLLIQLHGIFRRAQMVWAIPINPLARVEKHPMRPSGDIQVFSPEEVWALGRPAVRQRGRHLPRRLSAPPPLQGLVRRPAAIAEADARAAKEEGMPRPAAPRADWQASGRASAGLSPQALDELSWISTADMTGSEAPEVQQRVWRGRALRANVINADDVLRARVHGPPMTGRLAWFHGCFGDNAGGVHGAGDRRFG